MMRILAVSGSLQARSANRALIETAVASAPEGVRVEVFDGIRKLPLFDPDIESGEPLPAAEEWRKALRESDAVLLASPEYGFSLPGALKNAIDWVIGSGELERKVVGLTASVNHSGRGLGGLAALRNTLHAVAARIVGGAPVVRGPAFEDDVRALLRAVVEEVRRADEPPAHGLGATVHPKVLVLAWVDAFNRGDADALASFYTSDAVNHQVAEEPVQGREAIRQMFASGFALSTMVCIVENVFADGEWAILEWRDPKGLRGCGFFHVRRGQIVFQRGYWDKLSFLRQNGLPFPTK